jgi:hypothetical protein
LNGFLRSQCNLHYRRCEPVKVIRERQGSVTFAKKFLKASIAAVKNHFRRVLLSAQIVLAISRPGIVVYPVRLNYWHVSASGEILRPT